MDSTLATLDTLAKTNIPDPVMQDWNVWLSLVKVVLILAVLIAMLYGLIYFLKKYLYKTTKVSSQNRIKLLETFFLGPKSKLHLIQVGKKCLLLGEKENTLNCLSDVELKEEKEVED